MPDRAKDRDVARLVERSMRNWELARAQRQQVAQADRPAVQDFITISRTVGSGGRQVAARLAQRLDWPLFDKQILQLMAGDDALRERVYSLMDERDWSWFEETARGLALATHSTNDYFNRLTKTVLTLARQGRGVFLGRGADRILPAGQGLRVRIVAPRAQRLAALVDRLAVSAAEAEERLDRITQERDDFIERHFGVDAGDPLRHDLQLNLGRFSVDQAVELIVHAWQGRPATPTQSA